MGGRGEITFYFVEDPDPSTTSAVRNAAACQQSRADLLVTIFAM